MPHFPIVLSGAKRNSRAIFAGVLSCPQAGGKVDICYRGKSFSYPLTPLASRKSAEKQTLYLEKRARDKLLSLPTGVRTSGGDGCRAGCLKEGDFVFRTLSVCECVSFFEKY